nr:Toll-like receptor 16 [Arenicola marina]
MERQNRQTSDKTLTSHKAKFSIFVILVLSQALGFSASVNASSDSVVDANGRRTPDILCPTSCSCVLNDSIHFMVNCSRTPDVKDFGKSLSLMFDRSPNISTLIIQNSGITNLETLKLCKLQKLETLNLDNNSLMSLGDGLLQCLHNLRHLSADHNEIKVITENTFKGLDGLSDLSLQYNNMAHITPVAFTGFNAISRIDMSHNRLVSLDIWPLYLAVHIPTQVYVDLSYNDIRLFTNDLNWRYRPFFKPKAYVFNLLGNNISHISDLRNGWGLSTDVDLLSLYIKENNHFILRHNPLLCDCVDFNVYKYVKLMRGKDWMTGVRCKGISALENRPAHMPLADLVCHVTDNCSSGCDCIERPADTTLTINCQNLQLQDLPLTIPTKSIGRYDYEFTYKLLLANNVIKNILHRSYFHLLDVGDFSQNKITVLDKDILRQWTLMSHIYLDNNKLTTLPHEITSMEFKNLRNMTLHQNLWHCDCEHTWFKSWILNMTGKIGIVNAILCNTPARLQGRSLTTVPDEEFCSDPVQEKIVRIITITVSVIGSVVVVVTTSLSVAYYMRVRVFARFQWHPFNYDECQGENKEFDVFVSCAHEDEVWVKNLIRVLEEKGYRTCFHRTYFKAGNTIVENVSKAVEGSKRTLCVLSPAFAASKTCMWEFKSALSFDLLENKHRLITILKELIPVEEQDPSLKDYLRRFTYIEADSRHFWDNLCYSLSVKKIGPTTTEPNEQLNRSTESLDEEEAMQGPLDHQMPLLNMVAT